MKNIQYVFLLFYLKAFECELCQLKPSPIKCPNGQWTPEAQNRFEQFVNAAKVLCIKVTMLSAAE